TGAEVSGDFRIAYRDRSLSGERATITPERIDISGRVVYDGPEANVYGQDAVFDRVDQSVFFGEAGFEIPSRPARGSGENIVISGAERRLSLSSFFFTTCPEGDQSWRLDGSEIELDFEQGFGTARNMKLEVKGVPILYAPYFTFAIDDRRQRGRL